MYDFYNNTVINGHFWSLQISERHLTSRKPSPEVAPTTLATFFLVTVNLTLTFESDLDSVKENQHAKCIVHKLLSTDTYTHTPDRLLDPDY